ncbi:MAG: hypothetical protein ACOY5B_06290 [Spirochaetota bacterium]
MDQNAKLRNLLFGSVIALLLSSIALAIVHPVKPVKALQPGVNMPVVGLEMAWTTAEVWDIIGDPQTDAGQEARRAFALGTWLDFGYIFFYSVAYLFLNLLLISRHSAGRSWIVLSATVIAVTAFGDIMENRSIFRILDSGTQSLAAEHVDALVVFTRLKWLFLGVNGLPAAVLLRREGKRGLSFILTAAFAFGALGVLKQYAIELMTIFLAFFWAYLIVKLLPLKNRWWS